MGWNLIKSIQKNTDLRLIVPFGLNLKLGDVVSVNPDNGEFRLEGNSVSILDVPVADTRPPQDSGVNLFRQAGSNTSIQIRGQGQASSYFPQTPSANAGFDLHFDSSDAWILAMTNRRITALEQLVHFRQMILRSYEFGVWQPSWSLITSIATVDKLTLVASSSRGTKVSLSARGTVDPAAPMELNLTAGVSISAANQELIQSITETPSVAFCTGVRVKKSWFSDPALGDLETTTPHPQEGEFWEDIDLLGA